MPYTYRFIPSGQNIQASPKETFINDFQENVNVRFYESSDVYTVLEQTAHGVDEYVEIDVRINSLFNPTTGDKVEEDYKKILFKDIDHAVLLGKMYQFDSNYWITVNTDKIKTLVQTAVVKRCNNYLRWIGTDGGYYEVPCSLNYLITENRDYATAGSAVVVPSGMLDCMIQYNSITNKIKPNQRFLFGNPDNWTAYRVEGGGINNFNNLLTGNNNSAGTLRLSLAVDYINEETDDLENGIANSVENVYTLTLNPSSISGDTSQTVQLSAIVKLNNQIVSRSLVWESDDETIATVNSSGLVTFVDEGSATITCSLLNNSSVSDTCSVTVGASPVDNYQLIFSPQVNFVLEGQEKTWSVYLYKNGVQQADVIAFSLDPNSVPNTNYIYQVLTDNTFKITNYERYLTDYLEVTAVSGIYTITLQIYLRGAW